MKNKDVLALGFLPQDITETAVEKMKEFEQFYNNNIKLIDKDGNEIPRPFLSPAQRMFIAYCETLKERGYKGLCIGKRDFPL